MCPRFSAECRTFIDHKGTDQFTSQDMTSHLSRTSKQVNAHFTRSVSSAAARATLADGAGAGEGEAGTGERDRLDSTDAAAMPATAADEEPDPAPLAGLDRPRARDGVAADAEELGVGFLATGDLKSSSIICGEVQC